MEMEIQYPVHVPVKRGPYLRIFVIGVGGSVIAPLLFVLLLKTGIGSSGYLVCLLIYSLAIYELKISLPVIFSKDTCLTITPESIEAKQGSRIQKIEWSQINRIEYSRNFNRHIVQIWLRESAFVQGNLPWFVRLLSSQPYRPECVSILCARFAMNEMDLVDILRQTYETSLQVVEKPSKDWWLT